ncbi:hypothetical protein [Chryseobacterium potabilaquae]|uniref:Uncharacterized protein n=1 Tax=Chryseobacterium potabilaquae TaxID=2675057 RepID=A0A6N4X6U4_9FLAO|nr:hypothetical protein [Chryseobacterium potabilaquae]CAA7196684.1 hypothetical protein CHRY9293_02760 [Chryseobacterium potabilaquae]
MKKTFIILTTIVSMYTLGQVGINTNTPQSTLDIVGNTTVTSPDGLLIPRFTVAELSARDGAYGAAQNGVLVFVTSGTGSSGKTSDIIGTGVYYYDNSTSKWKGVEGNSSSSSFNVTADQTSDYTVLPTDNFVKLNLTTPGHMLTLPTSGIPVGKIIYVSNIGSDGIDLSPLPFNPSFVNIGARISGILVYLGGTGNGSWDWVSGY